MYIIILLSAMVAGAGFVLLHFALVHRTKELKVAGWTLVIGAVSTLTLLLHDGPPSRPNTLRLEPMMMGGMPDAKPPQCHRKEMLEEKMMLDAPPPPPPEDEAKPAPKGKKPAGKPSI